jgi:hypothetical protein
MALPLAAVVPTARVARLGSVAISAALAATPLVVTVVRGGDDVTGGAVLLGLGAASSLAWVVDDPAGEVLSATPAGATPRLWLRLGLVFATAAVVVALALAVAGSGPGLPHDVADRLPEAAAAGAVALAVGFSGASRGESLASTGGVLAGLVVPAFVAALAVKWPDVFPTFTGGRPHARWWFLAAGAATYAAYEARDPGRR